MSIIYERVVKSMVSTCQRRKRVCNTDPISTMSNTLSTSHSPSQLEGTTDTNAATSLSLTIPKNKTIASFVADTLVPLLSSVSHQESSVQTVATVNYEMAANLENLKAACTCAIIAMPNTPLGTIWSCAMKSGFNKGSSMVDSIWVMDILKTDFEKGNTHKVMAEHDHHNQTCPGLVQCSMCEAGIQVIEVDLLNNAEVINILCAFSSTTPSTTPLGLV